MSYNKQTSLAANVEAIETAVKIHVQGRKAMAKEKETLSRYSGFGGIKEVLNIGTDNPLPDNMAEPMNRLQKALRTLAGGEETNVSQADGQPQGLCPHGLLHAAVPRGCRSAADTRRIHGVRPADALAARTERGHRRLPARSPARHPPLRL